MISRHVATTMQANRAPHPFPPPPPPSWTVGLPWAGPRAPLPATPANSAIATTRHLLAIVPPKRIASAAIATLHVHPPTLPPPRRPPPPYGPCIDEDLLSQLARCREVVERAVRLNAKPIQQKARPKSRRQPEMPKAKESGPEAKMPQEQMPLNKGTVPKPGDTKSGIGDKRTWADTADTIPKKAELRQSGSNKFQKMNAKAETEKAKDELQDSDRRCRIILPPDQVFNLYEGLTNEEIEELEAWRADVERRRAEGLWPFGTLSDEYDKRVLSDENGEPLKAEKIEAKLEEAFLQVKDPSGVQLTHWMDRRYKKGIPGPACMKAKEEKEGDEVMWEDQVAEAPAAEEEKLSGFRGPLAADSEQDQEEDDEEEEDASRSDHSDSESVNTTEEEG